MFYTPGLFLPSTVARRISAMLQACAIQPRGVCGASPSKISEIWPKPAVDARAEMIRTLYQGSGFKPYADKAAWHRERAVP